MFKTVSISHKKFRDPVHFLYEDLITKVNKQFTLLTLLIKVRAVKEIFDVSVSKFPQILQENIKFSYLKLIFHFSKETIYVYLKREFSFRLISQTCFLRTKELEDKFASKEKDYQFQIKGLKEFEEKAKAKIGEMKELLERTTFDKENYKAQLSGSDGRISALEQQLARVEATKNDSEHKLVSLYSILRRGLGIRSNSSTSNGEKSSKKIRMSYRQRKSNAGRFVINIEIKIRTRKNP